MSTAYNVKNRVQFQAFTRVKTREKKQKFTGYI